MLETNTQMDRWRDQNTFDNVPNHPTTNLFLFQDIFAKNRKKGGSFVDWQILYIF